MTLCFFIKWRKKRDRNTSEKGSEHALCGWPTHACLQFKRNPMLCRLAYGIYSPKCLWQQCRAERTHHGCSVCRQPKWTACICAHPRVVTTDVANDVANASPSRCRIALMTPVTSQCRLVYLCQERGSLREMKRVGDVCRYVTDRRCHSVLGVPYLFHAEESSGWLSCQLPI